MTKPLFLARLSGTQEQMGAQHGRLVADDVKRLAAFYRTMPERTLAGGLDGASRFTIRQVATAWQARLSRERPPELAARTRAFIAAAQPDVSFLDRLVFGFTMATMDSMQNTVSLVARAGIGPFKRRAEQVATAGAVPACSSVIAWGRATEDGELAFARNFDFPGVGVWDHAPAFVVCVPDRGQRYGFFASRGADTAVVTVVNEAGLVLAPHTRYHRGVTWGGAMIVDLIHDIARRAETLDDAVRIARERPASSSWGIAIGSAREKSALVLELAGALVETVHPRPNTDYLVCTNRYRNERMHAGQISASAAWAHHSDQREQRLRTLVEGRDRPLRAPELLRFLGDRHAAAAPQHRRHFGSILAQPTNVHAVAISPLARRAWVGTDRAPCIEGQLAELAWDWQGTTGGWDVDALPANTGFTARVTTDVLPPHDAATPHVREAVRIFEQTHDIAATRREVERAVELAPDDPSLRATAAWLSLEDRDPSASVAHVRAGLALESEPYRRGQLLACGARAAAAGSDDSALRTAWLDELDRYRGPEADELRRLARRRGRPRTNLLMSDAL